jgi:hypothetical protein
MGNQVIRRYDTFQFRVRLIPLTIVLRPQDSENAVRGDADESRLGMIWVEGTEDGSLRSFISIVGSFFDCWAI